MTPEQRRAYRAWQADLDRRLIDAITKYRRRAAERAAEGR
jgi:hypothetical protein